METATCVQGGMMIERITWVDYQWKDSDIPGDTRAQVVILNDSNKYEEMSNGLDFDQRIWFYFQDEAEFKRAFNPEDDEFEFVLTGQGTPTQTTDR
jgi:hypothetical protein